MASHIGIEECGAAYTEHPVLIAKGEQKSTEYAQINPRGKVPALAVDGRIITETVLWHITRPPLGQKITIWRADSGLIKVGPASWAETFFFETMLGCIALLLGAILGVAKLCLPSKDRQSRLTRKP